MPEPDLPQFVSIAEASRISGKDRKTLKRFERNGRLSIDRTLPMPRVPVAELLRLDLLVNVPGRAPGRASPDRGEGAEARHGAEVGRLQAELAAARERIRELSEDRERLWTQNTQLTETVNRLALAAPAPSPAPAPSDPAPAPASPPGRRGFWQRLFGGE